MMLTYATIETLETVMDRLLAERRRHENENSICVLSPLSVSKHVPHQQEVPKEDAGRTLAEPRVEV
jgi:hypothetical protein